MSLEQLFWRDIQHRRNLAHDEQRRVAPSCLYAANIGAVQSGSLRQFFLRPTTQLPKMTHVVAKEDVKFHARAIIRRRRLPVHRL